MAECETSFSLILEGKTMHQPDQIIEMMKDQLDKKLEGYQIEKIHTLSILHDKNGELPPLIELVCIWAISIVTIYLVIVTLARG